MSADDTTDAVAEAREMIAAFEVISNGRTRYEGQPERADERYDRNRRALVARIEDLEAKLAAVTRERDAAERTSRMQYERLTSALRSAEAVRALTIAEPAIERALAIAAVVDERDEEEMYLLARDVGPSWDNSVRRNMVAHGRQISKAVTYIAEKRRLAKNAREAQNAADKT